MESRAKALGHPIHPMLIVFPLGLLATAVVFDVLFLIFENPNFPVVAYWLIIAGIVGGLAAALFGLIDWLAIPSDTRAKTVGLVHGVGNVVVVLLFGISWFLRMDVANHTPGTAALLFSFAGALLSTLTGWLGGELVYRLGMGVDRGANLEAPSSLSDQPASSRPAGEAGFGRVIPSTGQSEEGENREHH